MAMRSSSGYNNAAFSNQYDYDQLARTPANLPAEENITYIPVSAMDNFCYEGDEEIPMTTIVTRQQARQLVREPPIGASTTFRFIESRQDTSPQKYRYSVITTDNTGETIISPRTPRKNVSVTTSSPRKQNGNPPATHIPRRSQSFVSPRRPQRNLVAMPLSPGPTPRMIQAKTPTKPLQRTTQVTTPTRPTNCNVTYVMTPENSLPPHRSTAVIPPMYTTANSALASNHTVTYKSKEPFLATSVMNKSPVKAQGSPGVKTSWVHASTPYQTPPTATITTAAVFLLICGAASAILCFYMMYKVSHLLSFLLALIICENILVK